MTLIESINDSLFEDSEPERSRLQEAMFSLYLRNLTIPMVRSIGLVLIVLIGGVGELVQIVYPKPQLNVAVRWRLYICLILGLLVVSTALIEASKKWINWMIGVTYVLGSVVCGYYLSQLRVPHSAGMYVMYLLPLWTIIMPARLGCRTLVTSTTLLILPGMYLSIGWVPSLFSMVGAVLSGSTVLSVLLGHSVFYRLNREAFFDDRELKRRQQTIEFLARHDQLTGLYNRREFENKLEEEFNRSDRYDSPLSLLMMDLDHFKKINDTYGHTAGDEVLSAMGDLLNSEANQTVRLSDVPGRYGGEEFCLLLPETRSEGALTVANRIRERLKEREFRTDDGETFSVTCSAGVSTTKGDTMSREDLIQSADDALYEAKNSGRDRVVVKDGQSN